MRTFTGCVIDESLSDLAAMAGLRPFAERTVEVPSDPQAKVWHVRWYQIGEEMLRSRLDALAGAMQPCWYAHFWHGDDLCVILADRAFWMKASDPRTQQAMLTYGDSVGVERKWTELIPTQLPAWAQEQLQNNQRESCR